VVVAEVRERQRNLNFVRFAGDEPPQLDLLDELISVQLDIMD